MGKKKRERDGDENAGGRKKDVPRLLAWWQRALVWIVWIGFVALAFANSEDESLSFVEFLALGGSIAVTVLCYKNPLGIKKVVIRKPDQMRGELVSRTNWPLILLGAGLTLGGVAAGFKIAHDLSNGFVTIGGVFEDIANFFLEWLIERLSGGTSGDVTNTRMYALILLIPPGLLVIFFNILPLIARGSPFRVTGGVNVDVWRGGEWHPLRFDSYRSIVADPWEITFDEPVDGEPSVAVPQGRVFSRELGTRVESHVIAAYFRERAVERGFAVEGGEDPRSTTWTARRPEAQPAASQPG